MSALVFTGERCIIESSELQAIHLEHLHRYYVAADLCKGKKVLDCASGSGYGSAMLASKAESVVGIDISEEAVAYSRERFIRSNLSYIIGSATDLPFDDASFDVIVSFETLEHINEQDQIRFLAEVKRVLKPKGLLIISTVDKLWYTDSKGAKNPYHLYERTKSDFCKFINGAFSNVSLLGQRVYTTSVLAKGTRRIDWLKSEKPKTSPDCIISGGLPANFEYLIAFASDAKLPSIPDSVNIDINGDIVRHYEHDILKSYNWAQEQLQMNQALAAKNKELELDIEKATKYGDEQLKMNEALATKNKELELDIEKATKYGDEQFEKSMKFSNKCKSLELDLAKSLQCADKHRRLCDKLLECSRDDAAKHYQMAVSLQETENRLAVAMSELATTKASLDSLKVQNNNLASDLAQQKAFTQEQLGNAKHILGELQEARWQLKHPFRHMIDKFLRLFAKKEHLPPTVRRDIVKVAEEITPQVEQIVENASIARLKELWSMPFDGLGPSELSGILKKETETFDEPTTNEIIDIIIPVYNGLDHLRRLLPNVFQNTTQPHRFIFVNDCSPDANVKAFILDNIKGRNDCIFIENEENLGFPGTVNHGASLVRSDYFVLLNTDVLVPSNWLERMIAPFRRDNTVCTTTPFTNSAVFYSFPNFGENHMLKCPQDFEAIDRIFRRVRPQTDADLEFINGTGFCMGIRKSCWDAFGGLDADTFGKGYGEETDLCLRYLQNGYRNILVPNLYVYHNHGGSFSSEAKKRLTQEHLGIIKERWSEYLKLLNPYVQCDPWAKYRLAVLREQYAQKTDILFIDLNSSDGGACKFRIQQEQSELSKGTTVVSLLYSTDNPTRWSLTFPNEDGRPQFRLKNWRQAADWIRELAPKEIRVNNLAFCQDYKAVLGFFTGTKQVEVMGFDTDAIPSAPIASGFVDEAAVDIPGDGLIGISIVLGTYGRKNDSILRMSLLDNAGCEICEIDSTAAGFTDNTPASFTIPPGSCAGRKIAKIRLSSPDATYENCIAAYHKNGTFCYSYVQETGERYGEERGLKLWYCFHDFLSCCPSFFLLGKDDLFCDYRDCNTCLEENGNRLFPEIDIVAWREMWGKFLKRCYQYRFFSQNTYNLVRRVHDLPENKVLIKGHDKLVQVESKYRAPEASSPLHIAVVGAWSVSKGSRQVVALASLLKTIEPDARIHFYGKQYDMNEEAMLRITHQNIIWEGAYDIKDLPERFSNDGISVVFFSSIYPETFSFVTQECIDMGIPVVGFDIGASGDRIRTYRKGCVVNDFSALTVYEGINKLLCRDLF